MDIGMIFGLTVEFAVGFSCIILGMLIWKKQKVSLIHDYHYRNVKDADIPAYSKSIGIGLTIIGAGVCIAGILDLFKLPFWWIAMPAGFIIGLVMIIGAQRKYNGSL